MDDFQQNIPIVAQTLAKLRDSLDVLDTIAGNAPDDMDLYRTAQKQKIAIDDRISTLLNLQLVQDTDAMQALVPGFKQAKADLDAVVGKICKASEVVDKVTKILGVVDAIVAVAKTVA
jgi:hypothetical protein